MRDVCHGPILIILLQLHNYVPNIAMCCGYSKISNTDHSFLQMFFRALGIKLFSAGMYRQTPNSHPLHKIFMHGMAGIVCSLKYVLSELGSLEQFTLHDSAWETGLE